MILSRQTIVWDTFIYSGESSILIARLEALNEHCDYFVVVESLYTFSGLEKELDLVTKNYVLSTYGEKVKWVTITDYVESFSAWEYESWQRQQISMGLDGITHGDLLLLSDVDEIPNNKFILNALNLSFNRVLIAEMKLRIYDAHFLSSSKWFGTIAFRYQEGMEIDFQELRMRSVNHWLGDRQDIFRGGGDHFTTLVTAQSFKQKIKSFSHTEFNVFPYNTKAFLFVILKLGIQLNGSEILRLDTSLFDDDDSRLCTSKHKFDKFRIGIAKLIQPLIRVIFHTRVGQLSSPK